MVRVRVLGRDAQSQAIDIVRSLSELDVLGTAVKVAQDGTLAAP